MDLEDARAFGPTVAENLMRPPALEVPAAPNARLHQERQLEGAIDPAATTPAGRTHVPVRMIIE